MGNRNGLPSTNPLRRRHLGIPAAPPDDDTTTASSSTPTPPTFGPILGPVPTSAPTTGRILGRPMEDVRATYSFGRELGRGQFRVTYLVTHRETGQQLACKSIATRKLVTRDDIEDVRREVQIMHHLTGHRNVVELKGAYEDPHSVNLVMELCEGGELFNRIIAKGYYSERAAAELCRQIVRAVHTCHSMGVMHRGLKPENFLFLSTEEDSPLKVSDFELSVFFNPGELFEDLVGSAYYVAPEVLRRKYGAEADVWSAGVILYILLSGVPPFWGENEKDIFDAVLRGDMDFSSEPWPSISSSAKDLVKKMLHADPKKRLSAVEVLNHPWIREDGNASDKPIDIAILTRMKQFRAMYKLKKVALKVITENLSEEEIMGLKEMFKTIDTDNSGTITYEELKAVLPKLGTKLPESEVRQLMEATDVDGNGTIDYIEFISVAMHMNRMEKEDHLFTALMYFDEDKSGYITKKDSVEALKKYNMDELKEALKKYNMDNTKIIKEIIAEVDTDNEREEKLDAHADEDERRAKSKSLFQVRSNASFYSVEMLMRELAFEKPNRYSFDELATFTSNFDNEIGFGAFGNVYKGQFSDGTEVAVKVLKMHNVVHHSFLAEIRTMGKTDHQNLIKLIGFCLEENMLALVYEYMANGSLDMILYKKPLTLEWDKLYAIAVELANALAYLHHDCGDQIIHHDIKASNVLLDSNYLPKLSDFGLANLKDMEKTHLTLTKCRGTPGYAAPEIWTPFSPITSKVDVYSFGMILFEILGTERNNRTDIWFPSHVWEKFNSGTLDNLMMECGISEKDRKKAMILSLVALWCAQFTPQTRPSMSKVATVLQNEILVKRPPNPFLPSFSSDPMQPA